MSGPGRDEAQMADEPNSAAAARRRAAEARQRAKELGAHLAAVHQGAEIIHGSSAANLAAAAERAERAHERLRLALLASAHAHDRAAMALEDEIKMYGDTDGLRARRAADHRLEAEADRLRAGTGNIELQAEGRSPD
jgi:hypothetical protein